MCFHTSNFATGTEMQHRFKTKQAPEHKPSWHVNGFDFATMPTLVSKNDELVWQSMSWGLLPNWVKNSEEAHKFRTSTLNAKSETIFETKSFQKPILSQRCVIPVNGFFEWKHVGKIKIPYFIFPTNDDFFTLAGVFETSTSEHNLSFTFSILTCDANELMQDIHNTKKRMPLILNDQQMEQWLNPSLKKEEINALLKPFPSERMQAHTIHKDFMKLKNEEVIKKTELGETGSQLSLF